MQAGSGFAFPSVLDANNYPNGASSLTVSIFGNFVIPSGACTASAHCIFDWQGSQGTSAAPGMQISQGSPGFTVVSGSSFVSGSTSFNLSTYGTNGSIEFYSNGTPTVWTFKFLSGTAYGTNVSGGTTLSNARIYLKSNQTALNNGAIFNPDFINALAAVNPAIIRTLVWSDPNDNNNFTTAALQTPVGAFTYANSRFDPTVWAGTISGGGSGSCPGSGDAYSVTLVGASAVDGQTIQGIITTANTTTCPTLALNGGTAYPLTNMSAAAAPAAGTFPANCIGTFIFDGVLQEWLANCTTEGFGITAYVPLSVQVALANALNKGLWYNWPPHITDASVVTMAAAFTELTQNFYSEYANEVWNSAGGFPQTAWATARGAALGFPNNNNRQYGGFYGLRVRQIQAEIASTLGATLKRVLATQAFGPTASTNTYRMQGADLCGTSCSNATYQSLVGVNYNASPNRPIDYTDVFSYATYYQGAVLNDGTGYGGTFAAGDLADCSVAGTNSGGLLCASNNYALGTMASIAAAFAWIDNDARQGTKNGTLGTETLLSYASNSGSNIYAGWETVIGGYSGKVIVNYEGGYSGLAPTVAQCNAMSPAWPGTAATDCGPTGKIATMLAAYKANALFTALVTNQFQQFMVGEPAGSMPAWFLMDCSGCQWGLYSGDIYSTPFSSLAAVQSWNR